MNQNGTLEKIAMTNGTEGGVLHLLRLTRTQCHAWVAFVALRQEDGTIEITAVPNADDERSEWTVDTLQGIVRQTLEDPLIGEGRAVIRVSEVFRRYWPGERQYTRMAVAPLNDVAEPGRPWGLLCALDPVDGQFSEPQLDMLGRLAVRFINHLRARRQFVADSAANEALLSAALPEEPPALAPRPSIPAPEVPEGAFTEAEALPNEGIVRIERAATWLARQAEAEHLAEEPAAEAPAPEAPFGEAPAPEVPIAEAPAPEAPIGEAPAPEAPIGEAPAPEVSFAGAPAPEAPFGEAPAPEVSFAGAPAPEAGGDVQVVFGEAFAVEEPALAVEEPVAPAVEEPVGQPTPVVEEPAPVFVAEAPAPTPAVEEPAPAESARGSEGDGMAAGEAAAVAGPARRVRLSELIDQLDETIERLQSSQRNGALFLVELPAALAAESLEAASERLLEATRHTDVVLGVGSDMLAVVMELGPRPANLEAITARLASASAGSAEASADLRASTVRLEPGSDASGEALVLSAVRQLGSR